MNIEKFVISSTEPKSTNVGWIKPMSDQTTQLLIYNRGKWTSMSKIESVGQLLFEQIKDVPDINI